MTSSFSRHDAIYADVINLLKTTGLLNIETCSFSRNDRGRSLLPLTHFGNGTNTVCCRLPFEKHDPNLVSNISAAIRNSIELPADNFHSTLSDM